MTAFPLNGGLEPEPGEHLLEEIRPDRTAYLRGHLVMAVIGGIVAGAALLVMGNLAPWVGPVGAAFALLLRGWYLAGETLGLRWQLTDRRLVVPGGRAFRLDQITRVRPFLGDVQIITRQGDKHLIKHPASPADLSARIEAARAQA